MQYKKLTRTNIGSLACESVSKAVKQHSTYCRHTSHNVWQHGRVTQFCTTKLVYCGSLGLTLDVAYLETAEAAAQRSG